jgi:putative transposase
VVWRRAYRYRLDPTPRQARTFLRNCGARRYAYNWAIGMIHDAFDERSRLAAAGVPEESWPGAPAFITLNNAFNDWKNNRTGPQSRLPAWWADRHPDLRSPGWLLDNSWDVYMWGIYEAHEALRRWFASRNGKLRGQRIGFPQFKAKKLDHPRFKLTGHTGSVRPVDYRHVRLPKIGSVHTRDHMKQLVQGLGAGRVKLKQATISRDARGAWWIAFSVEETVARPPRATRRMHENGAVAIDVGVKSLAVLSFGEAVPNPRFLDMADGALRQAQRAVSRRVKGSTGHAAAQRRVARIHARVAGLRRNHLHQVTSVLARSFAHVVVEDLNVKGMTASARGTREQPGRQVRQKAGLNRRILDVSFAEIRRQLNYKTRWYGGTIEAIDRYAPTSKTCSACGWRNPNLTLSDRTFHCGGCHASIDRDLNAARNIARLAKNTDHAFAQGVQAVRLRKPLPGHGQAGHFRRTANLAPRHGRSTIAAAPPGSAGQTRRPGPQGPGVPNRTASGPLHEKNPAQHEPPAADRDGTLDGQSAGVNVTNQTRAF